MLIRSLKRNISWGILWGLAIAVVLIAFVMLAAFLRAILVPRAEWPHGLSLLRIVGVYLFGGLVAGALVGLLRPALRWWIGRRIVGVLAAVPIVYVIRVATNDSHALTRSEIEIWLITAVIWGFVMSFGPEHWEDDARRNLERIEQERSDRK